MMNLVVEVCPYCWKEDEYSIESNRVTCSGCGNSILLCSLCDMDEVDCNNCEFKNI